mgnify:CR=1 FL=1|jgi:hypothetical protein|tara:strand:+ start:372 stop:539 length:168 start_codon:yes stop_codon:yes gene_type:complete
MIVKVYITLEVDEDDYQIPADENPSEEIRELLRDILYDVDGLTIKYIKTKMEKNT